MEFYIPLQKAGVGEGGEKIPNLQGRRTIQGMDIAIENEKGSYRKWYDTFNKTEGKTLMKYAYGYMQGTLGVDGDKVDIYIGDNPKAEKVYVVHQMKTPNFKEFDEDKCMVGFDSAEDAKKAYLGQYNNPKFFGSMTEMSVEEFKKKAYRTEKKPQMIKSVKGDTKKKSNYTGKTGLQNKEGKPEEQEFETVKLNQEVVGKTFAGKKMKPGSNTVSNMQKKSNRLVNSPNDFTRPPYEDE